MEGDKALFNPYGVIAVNPDKNPDIHADLANQFIDWMISVPVQEKIADLDRKILANRFLPLIRRSGGRASKFEGCPWTIPISITRSRKPSAMIS